MYSRKQETNPMRIQGLTSSLKFLGSQGVRAMPYIHFKIKCRCFACCILSTKKKPQVLRFWRQHSIARKSRLLIYQVTQKVISFEWGQNRRGQYSNQAVMQSALLLELYNQADLRVLEILVVKKGQYGIFGNLQQENHNTGPGCSGVRPRPCHLLQRNRCPLRVSSWHVTGSQNT